MSKSKSKSKSKSATFPDRYWAADYHVYTYYPRLFEHGHELIAVELDDPPLAGDTVAAEIRQVLQRQQQVQERERRRAEIEWEMDHLSRSYQATLLTGPASYPKTWQLMHTMSDLALVPLMHFKKHFSRARPNQFEPTIEPLVEVPGHPSYPSGHATQNFLIAHVLSEVIGDDAELIARVFAIARRVAENREWAGLHYASDTEAGEKLAREMLPTMKRALAAAIEEAVLEWQEIEPFEQQAGARREQPAVVPQLQEAPAKTWPEGTDDPFPSTHFRKHQWNLENVGLAGAKRGVDINVRGAWDQLGTWQDATTQGTPVRVALVDLAIDFEHPALARRLDYDRARNLDYPNVAKDRRARYLEAFGSFSSAHATASAGIIAADAKQVKLGVKSADGNQREDEPGCLGIAPHSCIIPYRAMTLTEPVLHKRQLLARAVLEAATGQAFVSVKEQQPRRNGSAARWQIGDKQNRFADVLLFPLPLDPLSEGRQDPLALALAFAATKIPVIIPSGNKGTSSLSYLSEPSRHIQDPESIDQLSELFDLEPASVRAVFGPDKSDEQLLKDLIFSVRKEAAVICVGACNDRGLRSRYSQYGEGLTLVAPSDDVLPLPHQLENGARRAQSIATTDLKGIGGYMQDQSHYTLSDNEFGFGGTSAAAAQVAGVVALMLQANPRLYPREIRHVLCETARVKDAQGNNLLVMDDGSTPPRPSVEFGYGIVDAARAVEEARRRAQ